MIELSRYLEQIIRGQSLSEDESSRMFQMILMGGATPAQIAAILVALRMKGETIAELTGAARMLRSRAGEFPAAAYTLDTCGTGGDSAGTWNISTAVSFIVAAAGIPVAKHGNRAVSSQSGSADVLSALGVKIDAETETMARALHEANICFLFAPKFHSAMRHVAPTRKEIGVRTVFNLLGPLANPAKTRFQLLGVYHEKWLEPLALVLGKLGCMRAWVVHGKDGLDEITTTTTTQVVEWYEGKIKSFTISPEDLGIPLVSSDALTGGDAMHNAKALRALLSGTGPDAYRDIVCLNAAACLTIAGKSSSLQEGLAQARSLLESGAALKTLQQLISLTNEEFRRDE
jgi:anthranilate phosphoribosyltransferase